ncbi:helix-turn-helix transcriptional regulator [Paenibacillus sp. KS-LC4]|uniref:helix-turn-helix transcriptional regulator n=1 Tax=Paenibacillus sp. KS-LC4 TaxID=2979727 RepID=UPI0030D33316
MAGNLSFHAFCLQAAEFMQQLLQLVSHFGSLNTDLAWLSLFHNRTHFTKQFSKAYGTTPVQYIQRLKMGEATRLLAQTSYTLSEIASSIGFPDLFSFSKAFKKIRGVSPKQYRSQLISGQRESND